MSCGDSRLVRSLFIWRDVLFIATVVLAVTRPAIAATFHVSPTGTSTLPYSSEETAATNVSDAVYAASGFGDTVLIHAGAYDIDMSINIPEGLTLVGVDRDSVSLIWQKLPGDAYNWMLNLYGTNDISGVTFVNPLSTAVDKSSSSIRMSSATSSGSLRVHDCRFDELGMSIRSDFSMEVTGNDFLVWSGKGIATALGSGQLWVHDNTFFGGIGGPSSGGTGVLVSFYGDAIIEDNVFDYAQTGTRGDPIRVDRFPASVVVRNNLIDGGQAHISWWYTSGYIENNTILGPENPFRTFEIIADSTDTVNIRNNVFIDFEAGPEFSCGACSSTEDVFVITYNSFWPPVDAYYREHRAGMLYPISVLDSANFCAYPMFADSSFSLQYYSPLIDAGDPECLDVDGSRSDIGRWGGSGGSTYVYLDLAPAPPESLRATYTAPIVTLNWKRNLESDLLQYTVHRESTSSFTPSVLNQIAQKAQDDTDHVDSLGVLGEAVYYRVSAWDSALTSTSSDEAGVLPTGILEYQQQESEPRSDHPQILRVYPNPFNSTTIVEFTVPTVESATHHAKVYIYNILGQKLVTLANSFVERGVYRLEWDGRYSDGNLQPTGLYFARLVTSNQQNNQPVKIVILR